MINWVLRPASWWQFWLPQSGIVGGAIMGALLVIGGFALGFLIWWAA